MYGYFDESIVSVDGKKYITLGAVFSNTQFFKNEILNHLRKIKNISRDKKEIKYTNIRNKKVREEVVQKIKKVTKVSLFMSAEIKNNKEIHFHINTLLTEILTKFFFLIKVKSEFKSKAMGVSTLYCDIKVPPEILKSSF